MFHGSLVALVTPMHTDGAIDYDALSKLVEWHIDSQTDGLVILGTTGESPTIEDHERTQIFEHVIKQVHERIPVIVGTGSNSTVHTIHLTQQAMELGADAVLLVTPYYNKPTQEGLYQHYTAVAHAVPIPQILYNVPGRTGCDLLPETAVRLSQHANIVAYKEASGDVSRVAKLAETKMDLLTGVDENNAEFILAGGKGAISVVANVAPKLMHELCHAALKGERQKAEQCTQLLQALSKELFCEANPIPVKWALHEMGLIEAGIRLPLTPLSSHCHARIRAALQQANCLKTQ